MGICSTRSWGQAPTGCRQEAATWRCTHMLTPIHNSTPPLPRPTCTLGVGVDRQDLAAAQHVVGPAGTWGGAEEHRWGGGSM